MEQTQLDPEQSSLLDTILVSSEALLQVVNDVLDVSKLEHGGIQLEASSFSLAHCIESALAIVSEPARRKSLRMHYLLDPEVDGWWIGDESRVRQILLNLLGNAVKFTEHGLIEVRATRRPSPDGDLLQLCVSDTGIGIPADSHESPLSTL